MKPEPLRLSDPLTDLQRDVEALYALCEEQQKELYEKDKRIFAMHQALLWISERKLLDSTVQATRDAEQREIGELHRNKEVLTFVETLISQKHGDRGQLMKVHKFLTDGKGE